MKIAIMQPYFLPYIGYFQLIHSVDKFVIYDNIEFTKKGWINRNKILLNGIGHRFTIPLKSSSDFINVNEKFIAEKFKTEKYKIIQWILQSYQKAPFYYENIEFITLLLKHENDNLFDFIYFSVNQICERLEIKTKIIKSSNLKIDHGLKNEKKVLCICEHLNANTYINAIGGQELYDKATFNNNGIELKFIRARKIEYPQFSNDFIPWLSIIDVLMFNGVNKTKSMLNEYDLVE